MENSDDWSWDLKYLGDQLAGEMQFLKERADALDELGHGQNAYQDDLLRLENEYKALQQESRQIGSDPDALNALEAKLDDLHDKIADTQNDIEDEIADLDSLDADELDELGDLVEDELDEDGEFPDEDEEFLEEEAAEDFDLFEDDDN